MSEASGSVFTRKSASDWENLARAAADRSQGEEEQELLRELLTFQLDGSPYAIPVERVREIVRPKALTPMPRVPSSVIGVIALRGEIVQVVDLRACLGLRTPDNTRSSRVIVLHGEDDRVTGVLVDGVSEVLRVAEDEIRPAGAGESGNVNELCVRGADFVSIIDLDRVLDLGTR